MRLVDVLHYCGEMLLFKLHDVFYGDRHSA